MCKNKHKWEPIFGSDTNSWCTECGMLRRIIPVGFGDPVHTIKSKYIYKRPSATAGGKALHYSKHYSRRR